MEKKIAKDLLSVGAVFLRPEELFTWASGIKSPMYCDNRLTLSYPAVRKDIEEGLAELIKKYYPEAESLMGTSTAGIAHAAITAWLLDKPMGYVRDAGCGCAHQRFSFGIWRTPWRFVPDGRRSDHGGAGPGLCLADGDHCWNGDSCTGTGNRKFVQ